MTDTDYTFTFEVPQEPPDVFGAVLNVRGWWSQRITGDTDRLGEFVYEVPGVHSARIRVTELVPARRVAWRVLENWFAFAPDVDEWAGSEIVFDIESSGGGSRMTFTHIGLTPELDCFDGCSVAWSRHALHSLSELISTGVGAPITPVQEQAFR